MKKWDPEKNAFLDDFLRFLAPIWEAFGRQNIEKRLSEIRRKIGCVLGGDFGE